MPLRDVLQNFGDAIAGVDREAAYRKGMAERADIDATEAATQASLELARERRLNAEEKERQRAAAAALREQARTLNDPNAVSTIDLLESGFGDEYAGAQLGRTRAQEFDLRETVADPAIVQGMGDEVFTDPAQEAGRRAAQDALAPASAIASRRPGSQGVRTAYNEEGELVYFTTPELTSPAPADRPTAPRSSASTGPASAGGVSLQAQSMLYRQAADTFGGTYDPSTGRFAGLDPDTQAKVIRLASRATELVRRGADIATATDQALSEMQQAASTGTMIPPQFGDAVPGGGASLSEGLDAPAAVDDVDPQTGQPWTAVDAQGNRVIWRNGQWQPAN